MTADNSAGSTSGGGALVTVVIPTYNNVSLLLECLQSLQEQDYPRDKTEIIVVDNASTDRTHEFVTLRFPSVKIVRMETNSGFAVACNRGAADARGDYVAFLNNDAVADRSWLSNLVTTMQESDSRTASVASRIVSRDGSDVEFDGASSNLFGAGRPTSVWGWPDAALAPTTGSPLLFASGGAMLIRRSVYLEVGGFDPNFFAYFEDVDLGWRLWVLGYKVVYAPDAVVRHVGGATGKRTGEHRRYLLWECNALATVLKNYESGNMERILSAALLLEYRRALLSAGDSINLSHYHLGGPKDTSRTNTEQLPKISVAHLAAIDRFNSIMPQLMESRREIQANRVRSDAEILPLLGRSFEPQYAGKEYAAASRALVEALDLYGITAPASPNRVLLFGSSEESETMLSMAQRLKQSAQVAVVILGAGSEPEHQDGCIIHHISHKDAFLERLLQSADLIVLMPSQADARTVESASAPVVTFQQLLEGAITVTSTDDPGLTDLARAPRYFADLRSQ